LATPNSVVPTKRNRPNCYNYLYGQLIYYNVSSQYLYFAKIINEDEREDEDIEKQDILYVQAVLILYDTII
jgi:hypothetical protein